MNKLRKTTMDKRILKIANMVEELETEGGASADAIMITDILREMIEALNDIEVRINRLELELANKEKSDE